MGILVTGAVTQPGRHEVSGSATVFDALNAAGGVDKLGSLRDIRLIRSGVTRPVDFYGLLRESTARIPPCATAIASWFRRSGRPSPSPVR